MTVLNDIASGNWPVGTTWDGGGEIPEVEDTAQIDSDVVTLVADEECAHLYVGASGTLTGAFTVAITPGANDFLYMPGTIGATVDIDIVLGDNYSNVGTVECRNLTISVSAGSFTLTQTGPATVSTSTTIDSVTDNEGATLLAGVNGLNLAAVTLGNGDGTDRYGVLDCGAAAYVVNTGAIDSGGAASSALAVNAGTLNASGTITLDDIACTINGGTILGDVDLGTGGSLISAGNFFMIGDFLLDGGTIDDNGNGMELTGSATYSSGTCTELHLSQDGTSNLRWVTEVQPMTEYTAVAGADITLTSNAMASKATIEFGASISGKHRLQLHQPTANDFLDMQGTIGPTVEVRIYLGSYLLVESNAGKIVADILTIDAWRSVTLTQSGVLTANTTAINPVLDNLYVKLVLGVSGCDLGDVTLGVSTGTDRHGIFDPNGYDVTIDSLVDAVGAGGSSEFDFTDTGGEVTLDNTFDGSDITCKGPASGQSIFLAGGGTPVIEKASFNNRVYVRAGVDISDGGNVNVIRLATGPMAAAALIGIGLVGRGLAR